jgi:hypothetical protein
MWNLFFKTDLFKFSLVFVSFFILPLGAQGAASQIIREKRTISAKYRNIDGRIEYEKVDFSDGDIREDILTLCPLHEPLFPYVMGSNAFKLHTDRSLDVTEKGNKVDNDSFRQKTRESRAKVLVKYFKEGKYGSVIDGLGVPAVVGAINRDIKRGKSDSSRVDWFDRKLCRVKGRPKF